MRLAFQVAYIGTDFHGSQMQASSRTVEGTFIRDCQDLGLFDDWRKAGFAFSGRTDRGVHARRQICAFTTSLPERAIGRLNRILPEDCWCTGWAETDETFHPRYHAKTRTYRYYLYDDGTTDLACMQEAASLLLGTHNFTHFSRLKGKNPEKTILSSQIHIENGFYVYEITAPGFLWNMVRCIVTALVAIGRNEIDTDYLTALLNATPRMRHLTPAPAEGLILWDIDCGITFTPLAVSGRRKDAVRERRRYFETMKKVDMLLD
ncbi:tRNA pseudouridine(38-40) synthase TruA [Methanogenium organophilum]|uniref:tRNA pseudouridine synthase A n=1 Tax=Methanogenium organophilum TaxID=2199 RepID=A0A9X9S2L8_METOG|nr:tRNA pseudouridine(38-40) synthase TruA [Methanogenium organophilum]WAI00382.1 tRNA pseudouridine(38-40) synthase TruA [Methanogenium organophilum]